MWWWLNPVTWWWRFEMWRTRAEDDLIPGGGMVEFDWLGDEDLWERELRDGGVDGGAGSERQGS